MDSNQLIEILRGTLNPQINKEAENHLDKVKKIIGFCPELLSISMSNSLDEDTKQVAATTLKRNVIEYWVEASVDSTSYTIHENDREIIRKNILHGIVISPSKIRIQLLEALRLIIRGDFPGRWPTLPETISQLIMSEDRNFWMGGYYCLLILIKHFEYKKNKERGPINGYMTSFLDLMMKHLELLDADTSEWSVQIQKIIVKAYYNYTHFHLSLDIITHKTFTNWINVLSHIIKRDVPLEVTQLDSDDKAQNIHYNLKKWAMHIFKLYISKYSNPSGCTKYYKEFGAWFLKNCVESIITTVFAVCQLFTCQYVSPKVMAFIMEIFEHMIKNASCWNYLKQHFSTLLEAVLFKVLQHNAEDEEMWNGDPTEYIRSKYENFQYDSSPTAAASNLLKEVCQKRKGVLDLVMKFVTQVLESPDTTSIQKDAAFYIIGSVAPILLKKPPYASSIEAFLVNYAVPVFQSPEGYRRFRLCWLIDELGEAKISVNLSINITENLLKIMQNDTELPVKVMAVIALCNFVVMKFDDLKAMITPQLNILIFQMLTLLRESEIDEINDATQNLIELFSDEIIPIALDTANHLKETVIGMLNQEIDDSKEITILGIINTLQFLVNTTESKLEVIASIEPIIVSIIEVIFMKKIVNFYDEALSLSAGLTSCRISDTMWQVLFFLKNILNEDADQIVEMMPLVNNYLSVDKAALVANPSRVEAVLELVTIAFSTEDTYESYQTYAAKILEILLINFKGQIDGFVEKIVEMAICKLMKEIEYTELRTLLLQVILAAIYYNQNMGLNILFSHNWPGTNNLMINEFIVKLFENISYFYGIHDRKVFLVGMTSLLALPSQQRPQALVEISDKLMPKMVHLMEELKKTYVKAAEEDSDEDTDSEEEIKELDSDQDEDEKENVEYLQMFEDDNDEEVNISQNSDDSDSDADCFTTELESYETDLDMKSLEYTEFKHLYEVMGTLNGSDPSWYQTLVAPMNAEHHQRLNAIMELANKEITNREKQSAIKEEITPQI